STGRGFVPTPMDSEEGACICQCVYLLRRFAGCLAALEQPRFHCRGCHAAFSSNLVSISAASAAGRSPWDDGGFAAALFLAVGRYRLSTVAISRGRHSQ